MHKLQEIIKQKRKDQNISIALTASKLGISESIVIDLEETPLLKQNIQELILGCSHYPLIYEVLRQKVDFKVNIIDPSKALIKKFNKYFSIPQDKCFDVISYEDVRFFVTSKNEEFSQKVKYWLEINKKISLVNLRSND